MSKPMETQYRINWSPQGRLLVSALFYAVKPSLAFDNPHEISIYGYRHWYEGGSCWTDTYFKITCDLNLNNSQIFLCENPNDDELIDTAFKPISLNSHEDKLWFNKIYSYVSDWIVWSDESDCMVIKQVVWRNIQATTAFFDINATYLAASVNANDPIFLLIENAFAN